MLIGVFLAIAIELTGVQSLPVAVGVYLPITTSAGMFAGGIVRWLVERRVRSDNRSLAEIESGPGVLFSSGLIAGGAIGGIVIAAIAGAKGSADWLADHLGLHHALGGFAESSVVALVIFWEAVQRLRVPEPVQSGPMIGVALVAVLLNGALSIWLRRDAQHDLNVRSAFVHMLGDLVGSIGIIAGAIAIKFTGWQQIDPVLSILIGALIIWRLAKIKV